MTDAVGITVHHQEGVLASRDHEMGRVVIGPRGVGKKIRVRRFLFEVFDAPRAPKRFDLRFRELHQVVQVGRETTNRWPKVERLFRSTSEQEIPFAVASGGPGREQFLRLTVQLRKQAVHLVIGDDESIELPGIPVCSCLRRLEKLRPPNIQKHPFFFPADHSVTPSMRHCLGNDLPAENGIGV